MCHCVDGNVVYTQCLILNKFLVFRHFIGWSQTRNWDNLVYKRRTEIKCYFKTNFCNFILISIRQKFERPRYIFFYLFWSYSLLMKSKTNRTVRNMLSMSEHYCDRLSLSEKNYNSNRFFLNRNCYWFRDISITGWPQK